MGNFSRDTFNKLKHYVGVRLQQGVPLVDADWNEKDDIRKYELQAFLKWFVGNGVPKDNDGFRIMPVKDRIILRWNHEDWYGQALVHSSIKILLDGSDAAEVLGFGESNYYTKRLAPPAAQLTGKNAPNEDGFFYFGSTPKSLWIKVDDADPVEVVLVDKMTPDKVRIAIADRVSNLEAEVGGDNDFDIKGWGGPGDGAGICLVEGWDAVNECNLRYNAQPLYLNEELAGKWGVDPLDELLPPVHDVRTDVVYLDVWEREIDAEEDYNHLVNPGIEIETCVRLRREWVVRLAIGEEGSEQAPELPEPPADHVFYPLATLHRKPIVKVISQEDITDLRLTELSVMPRNDLQQITADGFGLSYALDHDGQPNLKVSLRECINAILRGGLPSTTEYSLTTEPMIGEIGICPRTLKDKNGDIWVFWLSFRSEKPDIWYKHYRRVTETWGSDTQLTTGGKGGFGPYPLEDHDGNIWLFWYKYSDESYDIWYKRRIRATGQWENEERLTRVSDRNDSSPFAINDQDGNIWVFWGSRDSGEEDIYYKRRIRATGQWEDEERLPRVSDRNDSSPFAINDQDGNIWVFWAGSVPGNSDIYYRRYIRSAANWEDEQQLTTHAGWDDYPFAIEESQRDIYVFWESTRNENGTGIWYRRYIHFRPGGFGGFWTAPTELTTETTPAAHFSFSIEDTSGNILVFWVSPGDIWYKLYSRGGWEREVRLTAALEDDYCSTVLEDSFGDIWVFWARISAGGESQGIWHKKLIPVI